MQKKSNEFQKVGGSKKAQLLYKKGLKYYISILYLSINQYVRSVAFWLRFGCVSYEKNATVALFFENAKNGATFWGGCGANATKKSTKPHLKILNIKYLYLLTNYGCAVAPKNTPTF